jgi:hypothetical protein
MQETYLLRKLLLWFLLPCFLFAVVGGAFPEPVTPEEAAAVANGWYQLRFQEPKGEQALAAGATSAFSLDDARPIVIEGTVIAYAFDTPPGGCIVIAADDNLPPIFYYSLSNQLDVPAVPPAQVMIEALAAKVIEAQTAMDRPAASVDPAWAVLSDPALPETASQQRVEIAAPLVGPLLTSTWDQIEPYNAECPTVSGEHCLAGCVGVAMAQIMRYWEYPPKGTGSHCYFWLSGGETLCAFFGTTTYEWYRMPDSLTPSSPASAIDAVATLCYHCGASVDTDYYLDVSISDRSSAAKALRTYFGYGTPRQVYKSSYTDATWYSLMKEQIDKGMPVLYCIFEEEIGHALVLDGYDVVNLVHLNMGWGGMDDGWYAINYYSSGEAIVDIRPNIPTISLSTTSLNNISQVGEDAPNQTFEVWNSGGGSLSYSISDNADWMHCEPTDGTSSGEHDTITVHYTSSALPAGVYPATITVSAVEATNTPQSIIVSLRVEQPAPIIAYSPTSLSNTCLRGEDAPTQRIEIWNSGIATLNYSVSDNAAWLSCLPTSGSSTGEHDIIKVLYSTSGLQPGSHEATITITASGAPNSPATIPVTLTVERPYTVWYVDGSVALSGEGTSWDTAFKQIQEGIDAASEGETVIVATGTYYENISFGGKNITLSSTGVSDPSVVQNTIIDGSGSGSVVTFSGTENDTCLLTGFTIRNANAQQGGGVCGGTSQTHTHATIRNNRIVDNDAQWGGGLCWCNGLIEGNIISRNWAAWYGGGLLDCDGVIRSNLIADNVAEKSGGGACSSDGDIGNNTFVNNSAQQQWGGGLFRCLGTITNCIFWANTATGGAQLHSSSTPAYCCIQDWTDGGEDNITTDPAFVDSGGEDYRLAQDSPCVDSGYNETWMADALDLNGNPRLWQGKSSSTVDRGAYEYGAAYFVILEIARGANGNPQLKWRSRQGEQYRIWSCSDLCTGAWTQLSTVDSQGETTSWTDTAPPSTRRFYRIELK